MRVVLCAALLSSMYFISSTANAECPCGSGEAGVQPQAVRQTASEDCCPPGSPPPLTHQDVTNMVYAYATIHGWPLCYCFNNEHCSYVWMQTVQVNDCCGVASPGATTTQTWTHTKTCAAPPQAGSRNIPLPNGKWVGSRIPEYEYREICTDSSGNITQCNYMILGNFQYTFECDRC